MGLAERINPDEKVLIIAAGNTIYAWDYGRPQPIVRRERRVKALTTYKDKLVDAGHYDGIRDTLTGEEILETRPQPISCLAEHNGRLYAAYGREIWGIHDLTESCMGEITFRGGRTTLLASIELKDDGGNTRKLLVDSGDYHIRNPKFDGMFTWLEPEWISTKHVFDTLSRISVQVRYGYGFEERLLTREESPIVIRHSSSLDRFRAAVNHDGSLFVAEGTEVQKRDMQKPDGMYQYFFKLDSELHQLWARASKLDHLYGYHDADRRKVWEVFRKLFRENKDKLPRGFRYASEWKSRGRGKWPRVEILDLPFDEACWNYNGKFREWEDAFGYAHFVGDGWNLSTILDETTIYLMLRDERVNAINTIASINGQLLVGGKKKTLEVARPSKEDMEEIICEFGEEINAMATIPRELYNDGIKQRVLQGIRNRAAHAQSKGAIVTMQRLKRKAA